MGKVIGVMYISDHTPLWMKSNDVNWGPKPFKVINGWFENKEFVSFVEESCKKMRIEGKHAYVLKEKMKLFRNTLRTWNKEVFGWLDLKVEEAVSRINDEEVTPNSVEVSNNARRFKF